MSSSDSTVAAIKEKLAQVKFKRRKITTAYHSALNRGHTTVFLHEDKVNESQKVIDDLKRQLDQCEAEYHTSKSRKIAPELVLQKQKIETSPGLTSTLSEAVPEKKQTKTSESSCSTSSSCNKVAATALLKNSMDIKNIQAALEEVQAALRPAEPQISVEYFNRLKERVKDLSWKNAQLELKNKELLILVQTAHNRNQCLLESNIKLDSKVNEVVKLTNSADSTIADLEASNKKLLEKCAKLATEKKTVIEKFKTQKEELHQKLLNWAKAQVDKCKTAVNEKTVILQKVLDENRELTEAVQSMQEALLAYEGCSSDEE
jgi:hypothetical protein